MDGRVTGERQNTSEAAAASIENMQLTAFYWGLRVYDEWIRTFSFWSIGFWLTLSPMDRKNIVDKSLCIYIRIILYSGSSRCTRSTPYTVYNIIYNTPNFCYTTFLYCINTPGTVLVVRNIHFFFQVVIVKYLCTQQHRNGA